MSDFGETLPVSEQGITTSKTETQVDPWRELKITIIETKALELAWAKGITGRRVDFPQPDGKLVWGLEIEIPLRFEGVRNIYTEQVEKFAREKGVEISDEELQKGIGENKERTWFHDPVGAVHLPKNIKRVRIIDLSPQEALPRNQRSIDSKRDFWHAKYITRTLTGQSSEHSIVDRALLKFAMVLPNNIQRSKALSDMFYDIFWGDKRKCQELKQTLEQSGAEEILFIHAHGGYGTIIGEQTEEVKGADAEFQTPGNRIDLTEVIERYDQPKKFGAILVNTCYLGKEQPPVKRIPVYRVGGFSGGAHFEVHKTKTLVSKPKE